MEQNIITKDLNNKVIVEVPINKISQKNINPRLSLDLNNLKKLAQVEELNPIYLGLVDKELIIVDGYHRFEVTKQNEEEKIKAFIVEFSDIESAQLEAFKTNVNHGLRLDDSEIARYIVKSYHNLLKNDKKATLIDICNEVGVPHRNGKVLYYWSLVNHNILENDTNDLSGRTFFESFSSLIKDEDRTNFSEEFKNKIKNFYNKYSNLDRATFRKALELFKEDKDYFEEEAKNVLKNSIKEVVEEEINKDLNGVPEEDNDREYEEEFDNGDDECEETTKESTQKKESVPKSILKEKTEKISKEHNNIASYGNLLDYGADNVTEFLFLVKNGSSTITTKDYEKLESLKTTIEMFLNANKPEDTTTKFGDV